MAEKQSSIKQISKQKQGAKFVEAKFVFILVFLSIVLIRLFLVSLDRSELKLKLSDSEAFRKKYSSESEYHKSEARRLRKTLAKTEREISKGQEALERLSAGLRVVKGQLTATESEKTELSSKIDLEKQLRAKQLLQTAETFSEQGRFAESAALAADSLKSTAYDAREAARVRGFWRTANQQTEINEWSKSRNQSCIQLLSHTEEKLLIGLHIDGQIRIWDSHKEILKRVIGLPSRRRKNIALSADGQSLAAIVDGDLVIRLENIWSREIRGLGRTNRASG